MKSIYFSIHIFFEVYVRRKRTGRCQGLYSIPFCTIIFQVCFTTLDIMSKAKSSFERRSFMDLNTIEITGSRSHRSITFSTKLNSVTLRLETEDQEDLHVALDHLFNVGFVRYNGSQLNPALVLNMQSSDQQKNIKDLVHITFIPKGNGNDNSSGMYSKQAVMELYNELPAPETA